ncbi:hypothetical protein TD95_002975 [Thielaviopsis punctulata]|uniref:Aquaporin n=1 Tax=Thielaviopsis punctulata TaxID=72032 RepID=A0A0F4ZHH9_9PEZI|nr:hypothetical protein TD95_002975 [Thielaviopsis punctulata]
MGVAINDLEKGSISDYDIQVYHQSERQTSKVLEYFLDFVSEMAGTFTMLWFGLGVNAQVFLSKNSAGSFLSINIAWGIGVFFGVLVGNRSGAHLNPAVTLTNVFLRGFPLRKFPIYLAGQVLGALVAALVIYANYLAPLSTFNNSPGDHSVSSGNSSAGIFATYPQSFMGFEGRFFSEFATSAMLMAGIYALDYTAKKGTTKVPMPIGLFFLITGLGMSSGWETAYALNPARDFGPRLATYFMGYGTEVFTGYNWYCWVPIAAPICGCLAGGILYDIVSGNPESPFRILLDWASNDSRKTEMMIHHAATGSTNSLDTIVAVPI